MSAFVLGKVHIDAMLTAALSVDRGLYWYTKDDGGRRVSYETIDQIGAMLVKTNVDSVRARYPADGFDDMPGPTDNGFAVAAAVNDEYHFARTQDFSTGQMLAAISCYEYQSCEHDGWEGSDAEAFCKYLRAAMCRMVPGYEGTWELDDRGNPPISMYEIARGRG